MAASVKVGIGTAITTNGGKSSGRVGAILRNRDGQVVVLSARHILEADTSDRIIDAESGTLIGRRIASSPLDDSSESINAISSFRIADGIDFEEGHIAGWVDLENVRVGGNANTLLHDAIGFSGVISTHGRSVRFQDPFSDKITHYLNLIEVTLANRDLHDAMRGRAGTLFVSDERLALGILIAVSGEKCLLAPLGPYATKHSLVLNSQKRAIDGRSASGASNVDLRALQAEATLMRDELKLDNAVFEDPEGLTPPDRLMKLLEETA